MAEEFSDTKALWDHSDRVEAKKESRKKFKTDALFASMSVINAIYSPFNETLGALGVPAAIGGGVLAVYFTYEAVKNSGLFNPADDTKHRSGFVDQETSEKVIPKIDNGISTRSDMSGLWMVSHYENGVETKREALGDKEMKKLERKMKKSDLPLVKVVGDMDKGYRVTQTVRGKLHSEDGPALQLFERQSGGRLLEVSRSYNIEGQRLTEEAFQARTKGLDDRDDLNSGAPIPTA